jgi:hypothetical protein
MYRARFFATLKSGKTPTATAASRASPSGAPVRSLMRADGTASTSVMIRRHRSLFAPPSLNTSGNDAVAEGACGQVRVATAEGRTVVVGIDDELQVWDVATGPLWRTRLPGLSSFRIPTPQPLVYSDHGFSAVLWWNASASAAWDLFTGTRLRTPPHGNINAAAVATVGQRAIGIITTEEGLILTWDLRTGKRLQKPLQFEGIVGPLAVAEGAGTTTLLAAADNRVWEWDPLDGRLRTVAEYPR